MNRLNFDVRAVERPKARRTSHVRALVYPSLIASVDPPWLLALAGSVAIVVTFLVWFA